MIVKKNKKADIYVPSAILSILAIMAAYVVYQQIFAAKAFVIFIAAFAFVRCFFKTAKGMKAWDEAEMTKALIYFLITVFCVWEGFCFSRVSFLMFLFTTAYMLWTMYIIH